MDGSRFSYEKSAPSLDGKQNLGTGCCGSGSFIDEEITQMNLIVTGVDESSSKVDDLRKRGCSVDVIPIEQLLERLKLDIDSTIADAVVSFVDAGATAFERLRTHTDRIETAQKLALEIRSLPDSCAMRDGRKWKTVPIIIALSGSEAILAAEELHLLASSEAVVFVEALQDFQPTFRTVDEAVREYRQKILNEFSNLGFLVSYENGRYRVGPALRPTGDLEGTFYFGPGDQRGGRQFYTVDRDVYGIQYEVELFEALINKDGTTEAELQSFFEENPHFLSNVRLSVALSHVPLKGESGDLLIPDFIMKPIVAVRRDSNWQVLDLKRASAKLLAGPARHIRLSQEVTQAIAQLRNYGDYFKNPENTERVDRLLGHRLKYPRLAVVIGRLEGCDVEALEMAQAREPDVRIVTYDDILERQRRLLN
jgi:hypothetical protein